MKKIIFLCFLVLTFDFESTISSPRKTFSHRSIYSILSLIEGAVSQKAADILTWGKDAQAIADDAVLAIENYPASVYARLACEKPDEYSSVPSPVIPSPLEHEKMFLSSRNARVQIALSRLLGKTIEEQDIPSIGFCGSGGGVRAQYGTLGWLSAADSLGLIDTLHYISGLSGSTWALNPWIASQLTIQQYIQQSVPRLTVPFKERLENLTAADVADFLMMCARAYYNRQALSPIDIYGWFLGHIFLTNLPNVDHPYEFTLSTLKKACMSGASPLVISTSSLGANKRIESIYGHYPTFEWTPLYAGSFELQAFVSTWAVGRQYSFGNANPIIPRTLFPETTFLVESVEKFLPTYKEPFALLQELISYIEYHSYYGCEIPLVSIMGICGSAFSLDMHNLLVEMVKRTHAYVPGSEEERILSVLIYALQDALDEILGKLISDLSEGVFSVQTVAHALQNDDLGAAWYPNICYEMSEHPLSNEKDMSIIDAGLDLYELDRCNIGIIPLLARGVECIFICDNSADIAGAPSLRAAQEIAERHGYPFPAIKYEDLSHQEVSLIVDETNVHAPILVYMPIVENKSYSQHIGHSFDPLAPEFAATEFTYSETQAYDLMGLSEYLVKNNFSLFKGAIEKAVMRKQVRSRLIT